MQRKSDRYHLPLVMNHWLLAILVLLVLVLGVYVQSFPTAAPERGYFIDAHISLGLTVLILTLLQLFLRLTLDMPELPKGYPGWLATLGSISHGVLYACLLLLPLSGYLEAVFSGTSVRFWGYTLPAWGIKDSTLADFFWNVHGITAFVLVAILVIHIGIVVTGTAKGFGIFARMLPGAPPETQHVETLPPTAIKLAQKLAANFRIGGWLKFWLQLVIAVISGLLLMFATSGRAFSQGPGGLADGMFWAGWAYLILWLTIAMAFFYTRAAKKIPVYVDAYINPERKLAFWFLGLGVFIGIAGLLASLSGVATSVSLLVAKTVSQPPGIAITDPTRIIRALDVFILLVNFNMLIAHFIGAAISIWLTIRISNARIEYQKIALPGVVQGEAKKLEAS